MLNEPRCELTLCLSTFELDAPDLSGKAGEEFWVGNPSALEWAAGHDRGLSRANQHRDRRELGQAVGVVDLSLHEPQRNLIEVIWDVDSRVRSRDETRAYLAKAVVPRAANSVVKVLEIVVVSNGTEKLCHDSVFSKSHPDREFGIGSARGEIFFPA